MISDKVKRNNLPTALKVYKIFFRTVLPFFAPVAVMALILSFFTPMEGRNARSTALIIFFVFAAIIAAGYVLNYFFRKQRAYVLYENKFMVKVHTAALLQLFISLLIILVPFYTFLVTSVKQPFEANQVNFTWWPQNGITFQAYSDLFLLEDAIGTTMLHALGNTLLFAIIPTTVGLLVSSLSAYGFSKLYFPGRNIIFNIFLFTMMLPGCITMTSSYVLFEQYGWTETALPVIIPGCFGGVGTVLFLREYFMGISNEILEAAKIDGAGKLKVFFYVLLPLGAPALIAQFVLGFISACNNFTGALIYLTEPDLYTVPMALNILSASARDKNLMAAAGMISIIPMLLLYAVFQKQILSGISMSEGLKG